MVDNPEDWPDTEPVGKLLKLWSKRQQAAARELVKICRTSSDPAVRAQGKLVEEYEMILREFRDGFRREED